MESLKIDEIVNRVLKELENSIEKPRQILLTPEDSYDIKTIQFPEEKEMGVKNPHNRSVLEHAQKITPARIGIGRTGTRMKTRSYLQFRIDHAIAQDAVMKDVNEDLLSELNLPILETKAINKEKYLMDLEIGRMLNEQSAEWLQKHAEKGKNVQIIVCDGLSSSAVEANIQDLLPSFMQGLRLKNISVSQPVFIRRGRVRVQDHVASIVDCDVVISFIGERPGLATAESLSAYIIYRPNEKTVEADRTVISNIHKGGLSPVEAGAQLSDIIELILKYKVSGVKFAQREKSKVFS